MFSIYNNQCGRKNGGGLFWSSWPQYDDSPFIVILRWFKRVFHIKAWNRFAIQHVLHSCGDDNDAWWNYWNKECLCIVPSSRSFWGVISNSLCTFSLHNFSLQLAAHVSKNIIIIREIKHEGGLIWGGVDNLLQQKGISIRMLEWISLFLKV